MRGLISRASGASNRPGVVPDLQFFSVHGRLMDLPSAPRVLGDAWRAFGPTSSSESTRRQRQRPACVLAFTLPDGAFNMNLSPDKRDVMFAEEAAVAEVIREGVAGSGRGRARGDSRRTRWRVGATLPRRPGFPLPGRRAMEMR